MPDTSILVGQEPVELKGPEPDDLELYSVTTVIGVLEKPALLYWAATQAAECAVRDVKAWQSIEESSGTREAVKWISGARFRSPKGERTAADLGTAFHAAAEQYVLTGVRPDVDDEIRPYLEQFDGWLQRFSPEYLAAEMTVYSPRYQYAGTCDGIFILNGVPAIFDLKTSKKSVDGRGNPVPVYPEIALQLAAYRHAELAAVWRPRRYEHFRRRLYLLSQAEQDQSVAIPKVEAGVGIKVTPTSCIAYPVECGEPVFDAFLWCWEAFRWANDLSKRVIGPALVPPVRDEEAA